MEKIKISFYKFTALDWYGFCGCIIHVISLSKELNPCIRWCLILSKSGHWLFVNISSTYLGIHWNRFVYYWSSIAYFHENYTERCKNCHFLLKIGGGYILNKIQWIYRFSLELTFKIFGLVGFRKGGIWISSVDGWGDYSGRGSWSPPTSSAALTAADWGMERPSCCLWGRIAWSPRWDCSLLIRSQCWFLNQLPCSLLNCSTILSSNIIAKAGPHAFIFLSVVGITNHQR